MPHNAEVVRERRPAKMVTAVRLGLDTQAELEALASARGIGSSTLMRHLDAARPAAVSLAQDSVA
jgi:hypothetical protein